MADLSGMHILCVPSWWPSPEQPISGIFFTDYARAFALAGARVGVVFPDLVSLRHLRAGARAPLRPRLTWESLDGIPLLRIRAWHTAFGRPARQMNRFLKWLRLGLDAYSARHGPPDALHAMIALPAGWACSRLPAPLSRRIVLTEETGPFSLVMRNPASAAFARQALAAAATVVTVSEHARADIRSHGIDRPIELCGNPVAADFCSAAIPDRPPADPLRALFVGRLVPEKGVIELAEAAARIGSDRQAEWHFAGDGPARESIRAAFARSGLTDRLFLHGLCNRARIVALMQDCDLLVHPTHGETFGQSVAEALCTGLPIVTTRGTACAEFIHDANGVLVPIGHVESLKSGLKQMMECIRAGKVDRSFIAIAARRRFSGEAVAMNYAAWFRAAMVP